MKCKKTPSFGSVSHGTLRSEDLIPDFAYELRRYARKGSGHKKLAQDAERALARSQKAPGSADLEDELPEYVNDLIDALTEYAPAYGYFGSHPGDGSDFGFWLSESWEDDFDGLRVSDTSEVPRSYRGEVLHVNDHGNATLYLASWGKLTEIWSVV